MNNENAKIIQDNFFEFCKQNKTKKAFSYLASSKDNSAIMLYNNIDDNEMLHIAANIISSISKKRNIPIPSIIQSLSDGLKLS